MAKDNAVKGRHQHRHLQRTLGTSVTAAANAGITTNDILKTADWSTASVFQKFYYKPSGDTFFGSTVLSTATKH